MTIRGIRGGVKGGSIVGRKGTSRGRAQELGGDDLADMLSDAGYSVNGGSGGGGTVSFANPSATAGPTVVNGSASTAMRSDAAPAVQTATASQKGLVQPDGTTIGVSAAGVISSTALAVGFIVVDGSAGTNVGPELLAPRAGAVTRCAAVVKASDASVALTFDLLKNGSSVFSAARTVPAGTAAGTVTIFSLSASSIAVALDDVFTLNITSGSTSWKATLILE